MRGICHARNLLTAAVTICQVCGGPVPDAEHCAFCSRYLRRADRSECG